MKRFVLLLVALFFSDAIAYGQTGNGTLRGKVADTADAAILGGEVAVTGPDGKQVRAKTNRNGEFQLILAPGTYTVQVTSPGFAAYENTAVVITSGVAATLDIALGVTIEETQVTVGSETAINTDPEASAGAIVLKEKDLEALPDDAADLEAALQALAGPGAGPNGGEIFIDGFSGGRMPPRDTIREIRINQNPFSSEYDRLGFGRIEILTKPGTDKFRGEAEFEFEDESFNSRNPFAPNRAPFQIRNFSGNLGGPLIQKRASFFFDIEHEAVDNNALINAQVLGPGGTPVPFSLAVLAPSKGLEFSPRIDFKINENNTLVARYEFERSNSKNSGLGGFDLLSRAFDSKDSEQSLRLTETAVIAGSVINEARFQYIRRRNEQVQADNSPTIRVLDAFTGGGANIGQPFSNEDRLEFQNYASFANGRHSIKLGLRFRHNRLNNASPSNFAGTFTFTSLAQYQATINNAPGAFPTQFTIAGGTPEASISQSDIGVFLQDDWRVTPGLTLSFGLRYENQTNISSDLNFAPRIAFAWAPGADGNKKPKTVFRGGFGVFYDRFSEGFSLNAVRFNGINQQQFVVTDSAILDGIIFTQNGISGVPSVQGLTSQPQITRIVAPDLHAPVTYQTALSIERQLPFKTTVSATLVNAQIRNFLRSRNINAPINGVRPNPAAGNIFQYESTGRFNQNQLILNFRSNFMEDVSIFANYSFGGAKSDSDGAGSFPVNQYDFSGEYGNSLSDVRHRFTVGSSFTVPWGISLSPFITYRSGVPFNITTGLDNNLDTQFNDRPSFATDLTRQCDFGTPGNPSISSCVVRTPIGDFDRQPIAGQTIIPRNYGRGPEFFNVNLRASKTFGFGGKKEDTSAAPPQNQGGGGGGNRGGLGGPFGGGGGGQRGGDDEDSPYELEFSVNIRNIFNRTNKGTPVGNLRSPFFGQPVSLAGGFGFGGGGGGQSAGNRRVEFEVQFSF